MRSLIQKRVIKSCIPAVNAPARIEISKEQSENEVTNESKTPETW